MKTPFRALAFAGALTVICVAGPALAIDDPVLGAAIGSGQVGEQADGYLGAADSSASSDVRARVNQVNLLRRETYSERAQATNVTVDQYARSTACKLIVKNTPSGGVWRDENNTWKRNTSGVTPPPYCPG